MKTLHFIPAVILLFFAVAVRAQVSVNVSFGTPPPWGPVGYTEVRYYYLPDIEAYYDLQTSMFIYINGGHWIHRTYLPVRYRSYDLYKGYKVVMTDYYGDEPYRHFREYRTKYHKGYHGEFQKPVGKRPGHMRNNDSPRHTSYKQGVSRGEKHERSQMHGHAGGKGKKR